jgi:hypothetical protein
MSTTLEKEPQRRPSTHVLNGNKQLYIEDQFPMRPKETSCRYTPVGDNHFRVVFFKIKSFSELNLVQEHKVCRSYFVRVWKDEGLWTHEVVDGKEYF